MAAVELTGQNKANTATCLADSPASLDIADVVRLSLVDAQGAKLTAQVSKNGKGHEVVEDDGGDGEKGERGKGKGREWRDEQRQQWAQ